MCLSNRSSRLCGCGGRSGALTDYRQHSADAYSLIFLNHDLLKSSSERGWNLRVNLVRGYFNQRLINSHGVANILKPAGHCSLGD